MLSGIHETKALNGAETVERRGREGCDATITRFPIGP